MKKFIPFKKEIPFKTQIAEITSISLEHNIHQTKENEISGNFIVSGEYKITDTSTTVNDFRLDLPFEIEMSDIYDISNVTIDIDDFYYEIKNMESLEVNITLLLDKITEKPLIIEDKNLDNITEDRNLDNIKDECYEPEEPIEKEELIRDEIKEEPKVEEPIREEVKQDEIPILTTKNIFSFTDDDESSSYIVYIVRENDTIETILEKYNVSIEKLKEYNDLTEIKKGDKIIIPNV